MALLTPKEGGKFGIVVFYLDLDVFYWDLDENMEYKIGVTWWIMLTKGSDEFCMEILQLQSKLAYSSSVA